MISYNEKSSLELKDFKKNSFVLFIYTFSLFFNFMEIEKKYDEAWNNARKYR